MKFYDVKPESYSIVIPIRRRLPKRLPKSDFGRPTEVGLRYFKKRSIFGFALTGLVLVLASLPLIFAFEAHVINVTAQIVGVILISTPEEAEDMLNAHADMTDKLERELLALKFNVAYFGVGESLVPGEDITISELIDEADALLTADFPEPDPVSDQELEDMKDRGEKTNNAKKVSPCKN